MDGAPAAVTGGNTATGGCYGILTARACILRRLVKRVRSCMWQQAHPRRQWRKRLLQPDEDEGPGACRKACESSQQHGSGQSQPWPSSPFTSPGSSLGSSGCYLPVMSWGQFELEIGLACGLRGDELRAAADVLHGEGTIHIDPSLGEVEGAAVALILDVRWLSATLGQVCHPRVLSVFRQQHSADKSSGDGGRVGECAEGSCGILGSNMVPCLWGATRMEKVQLTMSCIAVH